MKTLKFLKEIALFTMVALNLQAQGGNLEFNQAIIMTVNSGQLTVPAGKVWKVTASTSGSSIYYSNWTSPISSLTWQVTNPNPCTGATSGSSSNIPRIYKYQCPGSNNKIEVNGKKYTLSSSSPLWLPETTTVSLSSTPCVNSVTVGANTPYLVNDQTPGGTTYYECDGPINPGTVENGIIISILEFNIIP
jgi:hypothetical protein